MAHERIVKHGLVEYHNQLADPPVRRIAYRGETVHLNDEDLERLEKHGAVTTEPADLERREVYDPGALIQTPEVGAAREYADTVILPVAPAIVETEVTVDVDAKRPPQVAPKESWVDFAVAQGLDRAEAEAMTKLELVDLAKE